VKKYHLLCTIYNLNIETSINGWCIYTEEFKNLDEAKVAMKKLEQNAYNVNYCKEITGFFGFFTNIMGILEVD